MNLCPYCDGEGENLDMASCTDCNGTGFVLEIEHDENECYYCHGTGKDDLDEMGICKPCSGKGFDRPQGIVSTESARAEGK